LIYQIENVFSRIENYNCFACGPDHPFGLKLQFFYDDLKNEVFTRLTADTLLAGFPGILHGGLQATILDEVAFWGAWARYHRSGFTYDLKVRYRRKCPTQSTLEARGVVGELNRRFVPTVVVLKNELTGEVYTEGEVRYFLPDEEPREAKNSS